MAADGSRLYVRPVLDLRKTVETEALGQLQAIRQPVLSLAGDAAIDGPGEEEEGEDDDEDNELVRVLAELKGMATHAEQLVDE